MQKRRFVCSPNQNVILSFRFCYSAKLDGVHKELQKAVRCGACHFDASRGVLIMISKIESSQKLAEMMQEIYFRNLTQKVSSTFLSFPFTSFTLWLLSIGQWISSDSNSHCPVEVDKSWELVATYQPGFYFRFIHCVGSKNLLEIYF